jgi:CRISPR-associated protein Cas5h
MRAIAFNLSGRFAHFKKPDVNEEVYFTYSHIHKVALLGLFGAMMGLRGYEKDIEDYPEFYKELRHLKVAIIPKRPYFRKKIQAFNNSVGYASKEEGGNLIVKEQWLENPSWDIVVADDGSEAFGELKRRLELGSFVYTPYLGKNDHPANIGPVESVELQKVEGPARCDSLVPKDAVKFVRASRRGEKYYYEEYLPVGLKEKYLIYEYEKMVLSSWEVEGEMWGNMIFQ